MHSNKVSIIIPIYNAEKYLKKCLDSILAQKYDNIELILVNDGSTDKSLNICKNYGKKYKNIVIINKKNSGPSSARNDGLKKSTGDFILFVDSDDYLEENTICNLVHLMAKEKVDVIQFGYNIVYTNGNKIIKKQRKKLHRATFNCKDDIINYYWPFYNIKGFNSVWNKIYRSEIIKKNNIKFDKCLNIGEDLSFNIDYYMNINKIMIIDKVLYNYRIEYNVLTSKYEENLLKNRIELYNKIKDYTIKSDRRKDNKLYCLYIKFIYLQIMMLFHKNCKMTKEEKIETIRKVCIYEETKNVINKITIKDKLYFLLSIILKTDNFILIYFVGYILASLKK